MSAFLPNLLLFGRVCRGVGMRVTSGGMLEAADALTLIDPWHRDDVYHTLRTILVTRRADYERFDAAFRLFWRRHDTETVWMPEAPACSDKQPDKPLRFLLPPGSEPDDPQPTDSQLLTLVPIYSDVEALRHKHFAEMTAEELAAAKRWMDRLAGALGTRRTRRMKPGSGDALDMRRAIRHSLRCGGEILLLPRRERARQPRPLVLLCDISGSMERCARALLHFAHALAQANQVESFVFATRLTRITRAIRHTSIDAALRECGAAVNDWGGGTRTGEALRLFNFRWSRRVLGRGADVLIITDGWDRGDPELLRHEAERLHKSAHRVIWLNPLLSSPVYEPLTRGAQALLPHVDALLPVHNLVSLEALAQTLMRATIHEKGRRA
jgi:hypothetical protein